MKLTTVIAKAILTFVATPTCAAPLTPARLSDSDVALQSPGPVPISVSIEGLMIPGPANILSICSTGTASTGLPFNSHPGNLENFPSAVDDIDGPTMTTTEIQSHESPSAVKIVAHHQYRTRPTKFPLVSDVMIEGKTNSTDRPHRYAEGHPNLLPWGIRGGHGPVVHHSRPEHHKPSPTANGQQMHSGHGPRKTGHGPVVQSGFRTVVISPNPINSSNQTGKSLTAPIVIPTDAPAYIRTADGHRVVGHVAFHPETQNIGPRGIERSIPLWNGTSADDEELGSYVRCMNEPVQFHKVLAHMKAVEDATYQQIIDYETAHTPNNATNIIFKGLRFKIEEDMGVKILDVQQAHLVRQRLCQKKYEQEKRNSGISPRDMRSVELDAAEREWMAIEAQAIQFASTTFELDPAANDIQRLVLAMVCMIHGQHNPPNGTEHHGSGKPCFKTNSTQATSISDPRFPISTSTATHGQYPEIIDFKNHIVDANNITSPEAMEKVTRSIEAALESINMSDNFGGKSTVNIPNVNISSTLIGHSVSKAESHHLTNSTSSFVSDDSHAKHCRKNYFIYLSPGCKDIREQDLTREDWKNSPPGHRAPKEPVSKK